MLEYRIKLRHDKLVGSSEGTENPCHVSANGHVYSVHVSDLPIWHTSLLQLIALNLTTKFFTNFAFSGLAIWAWTEQNKTVFSVYILSAVCTVADLIVHPYLSPAPTSRLRLCA